MKSYKHLNIIVYLLPLAIIVAVFGFLSVFSSAASETHSYPRLANYYLNPKINRADYGRLASYDLVVLDMEYQNDYPDLIPYLRKNNPDIIILAYIANQDVHNELNFDFSPYLFRQEFLAGLESSWWLMDISGANISSWPGTKMLNITTDYKDYLVNFIDKKLIANGSWDGVFLDVVWDKISGLGNIDINNDGKQESNSVIDAEWQQAMKTLLNNLRLRLGSEKIILTNGGTLYGKSTNGRMFETFPTGEGKTWQETVDEYYAIKAKTNQPIFIVNSNTENTGSATDYQKMLFGLTSALLFDAYYSFDYGTHDHGQFWWYDEYNIDLGQPMEAAHELGNVQGVWERDFQNGLVLVNPTSGEKTINLLRSYNTIVGEINGASKIISQIVLQPNDGIILLKDKNIIIYPNDKSLPVKVFNAKGEEIKSWINSGPSAANENSITEDLNGDGIKETIRYSDNSAIEIRSLEGRLLVPIFYAYTPNYYGGINLVINDINNDGKKEFIVSSKKWSSHVNIFNYNGKLIKSFFGYDENLMGGFKIEVEAK
jgi:hypothetical protein